MSIDVSCVKLSNQRPGRLTLSLQGGSVFANFSVDYHGILRLRSISFDGFGAHRVPDPTTRMSASDSKLLLESAACHQLDSPLVEGLLRRYFQDNSGVLWLDALQHHDLL